MDRVLGRTHDMITDSGIISRDDHTAVRLPLQRGRNTVNGPGSTKLRKPYKRRGLLSTPGRLEIQGETISPPLPCLCLVS